MMMRYRITNTVGQSTTAELNPAAVLAELERGNVITVLGLSRIAERVNAVRTVAELLAREDITDAQYGTATALMTRYGITADDLNASVPV